MISAERLLVDHIHQLTREHKASHTDTDTGIVSYPSEMSLFDQLRLEQASGRRNTGGTGSGSRSPIAVQAVILWSEIRETLNTRHIQITGTDVPGLPPETKLQKWGMHALADPAGKEQTDCLRSVAGWVQAIRNLINPVHRIEVVGTCPVPECLSTHAWTWDEDEWVRNTAITAAGLEAQCGACGSVWAGPDLRELPALMEAAARHVVKMSEAQGMVDA
ncbi:DUF7341 domain-containing protein [Arthrobacter sp. D2-10]